MIATNNYYLKRVISSIITILLIATLTFIMMHSIPGGPFARERALPAEIIAALNEKYHLDDPLIKQYVDYMTGLITFDMGPSFKKPGYTVEELIAIGFPNSAKIGGLAILLIIIVGIPLGIISALKQNKPIDYIVMFIATLGVTIPAFVIASVYLYIFAFRLEWVDAIGLDKTTSYIGPVIALCGYSLSFVSRLTRSSMLEVLRQDYIRTARANGISKYKVIYKHALKNALIPVVTYLGPMIAAILTGSFVVERVFSIPGIGKYFVSSVSDRDYTVILGTTIFYAVLYVVMVLIVDVAYSFLDPRIRLGKKSE
ncbi:MAG: ABC transporter permease [Candidatus Izemoplasmatales bacterium]|nr:ABC transporter permease [Candidatus Izemoplasmatales bacterium]MDD3865767.1 ABC transporter permease [Candidatus Izemoplasmatales bacterium]